MKISHGVRFLLSCELFMKISHGVRFLLLSYTVWMLSNTVAKNFYVPYTIISLNLLKYFSYEILRSRVKNDVVFHIICYNQLFHHQISNNLEMYSIFLCNVSFLYSLFEKICNVVALFFITKKKIYYDYIVPYIARIILMLLFIDI